MAEPILPDIYDDFSEFYDLYVGDWLDDLSCCLAYAGAARTAVVEIGAGSGRLTIPIARAGVGVVALDVSAAMLSRLSARLAGEPDDVRQRVRVVQGDVCTLSLGTRHDVILVPFYAFNYLLTPDAQRQALERMAAHLSPGGRVLIDVFVPHGLIAHCPAEPVLKVDTLDPRTGNRIRGWNAYAIDKERQIETRRHSFEVTDPDGRVIRKEFVTQRRYSFASQLETLFAAEGFVVEDASTGYAGERADGAAEQLLYVLRRG